jgi:hypothetical protein
VPSTSAPASSGAPGSAGSSSSSSGPGFGNVTSIPLAPVPGFHQGTGTHQVTKLAVQPGSVPGAGPLTFATATEQVRTMLFQLNQNVVPNWFGVAVPSQVTDFSKPNIFFHPIPAQDGYKDSDYPTKSGKWPQLFYYMERLGYQLDGAIKTYGAPSDQVVIMPFLTSTATDAGVLPLMWDSVIGDILSSVQSAVAGGSAQVTISEVVVSSFSVGYMYSLGFRQRAIGLAPLLTQVWDFDGYPKSLSSLLLSTATVTATKYDQAAEPGCVHLPLSRWSGYPDPPPNPADPHRPQNGSQVHQRIMDFMYLHAAKLR